MQIILLVLSGDSVMGQLYVEMLKMYVSIHSDLMEKEQ